MTSLRGKRIVSELNPDLPVDAFLVEDILLAGDALDACGAGVNGGLNLIDIVLFCSPFEEVDEGTVQCQGDFFLDFASNSSAMVGGAGNGCVVVD